MAANNSGRFNLTQFLEYARTGLAVTAAFLVCLGVFQFMFSALFPKNNSKESGDTEMLQPDYAFGLVPAIRFPASNTTRPRAYSLQIPGVSSGGDSGWPYFGTPAFGVSLVEVYEVDPIVFSLKADSKIRSIAANLGFIGEPILTDARTFRYEHMGTNLNTTLEVDNKTLFVKVKTNYLATTNYFGVENLAGTNTCPDRIAAIRATEAYLEKAGILPLDLLNPDPTSTVQYMTSTGSNLRYAPDSTTADYVTVNISRFGVPGWRNGAETTYNFYGPDGYGSVRSVVGRDRNGQDTVVDLDYNYYSIKRNKVGIYWIRSAADAWRDLLAGNAYIYNPRGETNAVITSVELGYYESHAEQAYMLPIYVFKGNNDFIAYVTALDNSEISY